MSLDTNLQSAFNAIGLQVKQKVSKSDIGIANGIASLGADGKVPTSQLPSFVDDVVEYESLLLFPTIGDSGKIYVAIDTNKTYRWSGTTYVEISSGAVDSVAGKTGVVTLTKSDVGLNNVDNTSDLNKPISNATQIALDEKANQTELNTLATNVGPTNTDYVAIFNNALI